MSTLEKGGFYTSVTETLTYLLSLSQEKKGGGVEDACVLCAFLHSFVLKAGAVHTQALARAGATAAVAAVLRRREEEEEEDEDVVLPYTESVVGQLHGLLAACGEQALVLHGSSSSSFGWVGFLTAPLRLWVGGRGEDEQVEKLGVGVELE